MTIILVHFINHYKKRNCHLKTGARAPPRRVVPEMIMLLCLEKIMPLAFQAIHNCQWFPVKLQPSPAPKTKHRPSPEATYKPRPLPRSLGGEVPNAAADWSVAARLDDVDRRRRASGSRAKAASVRGPMAPVSPRLRDVDVAAARGPPYTSP